MAEASEFEPHKLRLSFPFEKCPLLVLLLNCSLLLAAFFLHN